jgi:hypothetical protein
MMDRDAKNVHQMVMASNAMNVDGSVLLTNTMVPLEASGSPDALLGGGSTFMNVQLIEKN